MGRLGTHWAQRVVSEQWTVAVEGQKEEGEGSRRVERSRQGWGGCTLGNDPWSCDPQLTE